MAMGSKEFRDLVMAELPSVYRMAYHWTLNGPDADDLVQETYLRALKAEASFRLGESGVRPWLLRILHNAFLTRVKRAKLEPVATGIAEEMAEQKDGAGELAGQALADLDWEQVDERLKRAIQDLPLAYRTVFLLSSIEGMKYREIAEIQEMPIGTVMSRLFRARTMLLEQLSDLAGEMGLHKSAPADESGR
jgi:RNA polymerase sigma-70 factor (ECF subfamily)